MKDYNKFVDECYKNGRDLGEDMLEEIKSIVTEVKQNIKDEIEASNQIMDLFHATKFEW